METTAEEYDLQVRRFETTLRLTSVAVFIADASGDIVFKNEAMGKLLRSIPPQLGNYLHSGTMSGWSRDDGTPFPAADWPIIRALRDGSVINCEPIIYTDDSGFRFHLEIWASPIRNEHGDTIGAVALFSDVTELRRAEMNSRLSEGRYRDLFETDLSANLLFGGDMRLLDCNRAAASMFGFLTSEAMREASTADAFPTASDKAAIVRLIAPSQTTNRHSLRLHRADGTGVIAVGTFVGRRDALGSLIEIQCNLTDPSVWRRNERKVGRLSAQLLNAQNEERRRLSHDLHDSAGQTLSALGMNLGMFKTKWPDMPKEAMEYLGICRELVQDCVRDIRTVSYSLHPPLLQELGIGAALRWYLEEFSMRSSVAVSLQIAPDFGRTEPGIEAALFRIVREALTNVHRHSGSKTAEIRVWRERSLIVLTVSDEGCGMPPAKFGSPVRSGGVGLASIRQQAALLNGSVDISEGPGTCLTVSIPLSQK